MSYYLLFILSILLFHSSFCQDKGCAYKTYKGQTSANYNYTNDKYLTSSQKEENKQKCFSLSNSDALNNECCYKTNASDNKGYCVDLGPNPNPGADTECPTNSKLTNNCGMALYYQPVSHEICTEISLVDGYCCYVETKNNGNVCLKQDSINEDNKKEISDYMKDYFKNKLKLNEDEIKAVYCKGFYFSYYAFLLLLLSVIYL